MRGERVLAVVGMEDPGEELGVAHAFERRVADEVLDLRAHVDAGAGLVEARDVHDERQLLDEAPVVALGLAHSHLGLVPLLERLSERRRMLLEAPVAVVECLRHLTQDREEGRVQEQQREAESDADGRDRLLDFGGDRLVGLVDLEHSGRLACVAYEDRDVGLEGLRVLAPAPALSSFSEVTSCLVWPASGAWRSPGSSVRSPITS